MRKRIINTKSAPAPVAPADTDTVAPVVVAVDTDTAPVALNVDTAPVSDIAPVVVNSDTAPADTAPVAPAPDRKAEFIERKSAAILSVLPLYAGESLSVHRSDKIPAAQAYLDRVASPVQKAKSATARDDSALLSYYDHITTYRAGDYLGGFNPDTFGADLGALSRNASLNRVALTDDKQHVCLTPLGLSQARNLVAKRDKH